MGRLFGTDGVRGSYGDSLTDDVARALGFGAATVLRNGGDKPRILIGRDTRASGPALERALAEGVAAAGGEPLSLGVIPTAGVAYLVRALDAAAGAVISASHNPARDNGIKFFGADGMKLPDATEDLIESQMRTIDPPATTLGEIVDADERYESFLLEDAPALEGLRVVVDCANGAASNVAPDVYRAAGADVVVIAADPDGTNINDGCGSTHPDLLRRAVAVHRAHVGLAHDGDADRVLAVDARGALVDGDQILGICALAARARGALPGDAVVSTVMSNLGFRRAMDEERIRVVETSVGDRYVLAAMLEHRIQMGGEQSGHLVFLDRHTTGDGILTALRLMGVMASTGSPLADLAARFPRYPQILESVPVGDRGALEDAEGVWETVRAVEADLGDRGRVLIRASGTEPVVRVMVEAVDHGAARAAADRLVDAVRSALGSR